MKSSRIYINSIIVLIKQMSKLKKGDMRSKYNLNVLQVPDHLITIFIVVSLGCGKKNIFWYGALIIFISATDKLSVSILWRKYKKLKNKRKKYILYSIRGLINII